MSIGKVKPYLRWDVYLLHIPLAPKAFGFTPFTLFVLPAKRKYVCGIIATIMEYDSIEAGMSLYCHGNRQTVFITGSFRLSLEHWKHILALSSYANIF